MSLSLLVLAFFLSAFSDDVKFTIFHTTDLHGFIYNHTHEPQFTARLGEIVNTVKYKKDHRENNEVVYFFDTGDLSQGTGLTAETEVPSEFLFEQMKTAPYDGLTMGNHDANDNSCVTKLATDFAPSWNGHYVCWNAQYTGEGESGISKYFTLPITLPGSTESLGNVLVTGFILNGQSLATNLVRTNVKDHLTDDEFADFFNVPDVKMIIVLCHIPTNSSEIQDIFDFFRTKTEVPIVFLTGHSHMLRYKIIEENKSIAFESGVYRRNLGTLEVVLHDDSTVDFTPSWLNSTNDDLTAYLGLSDNSFLNDPVGKAINDACEKKFHELHLDDVVACAPYTYINEYPPSDPRHINNVSYSLLDLLVDKAYPLHGPFRKRVERKSGLNSFYVFDSLSVRYPLYSGEVTLNDLDTIDSLNYEIKVFEDIPGSDLATLIDNWIKSRNDAHSEERNDDVVNPATFYWPNITVNKTAVYDIITTQYEAPLILQQLQAIGTLDDYILRDTFYKSRDVLRDYISRYMQCPYDKPPVIRSVLIILPVLLGFLLACSIPCLPAFKKHQA